MNRLKEATNKLLMQPFIKSNLFCTFNASNNLFQKTRPFYGNQKLLHPYSYKTKTIGNENN
jgi:hypothetical protein